MNDTIPVVDPVTRTGCYGRWSGTHRGLNFDVCIEQHGNILMGIKATGNDYLPAGSVSWFVDLNTMEAKGVLGDRETGQVRAADARIKVLNRFQIEVIWIDEALGGEISVIFNNDN
jgi:hypothetical protein